MPASPLEPTRIVIADDHPMVRRALAEALTQAFDVDCDIVEAGSVTAAREILAQREVDLVMLDLNMPGMEGLLGLAALRADFPAIPILVVSAAEAASTMRQVIEFGAAGFLPKSAPLAAIGNAVKAVLDGQLWLPEAALDEAPLDPDVDLAARIAELTPHQHRVLMLISEGKMNKQIAFELAVTEATVKAHISQILRKLGVHSRTQAVIAAKRLNPSAPRKPS